MIKKVVSMAAVVAVAASIGCAKKNEVSQVKNIEKQAQSEVVVRIQITPATAKLAAGESREFTVTGIDSKGKTVPVAAVWKIESGKNPVVTLNTTKGDRVVARGVAAGKATLEAEFNRMKAATAIEVTRKK